MSKASITHQVLTDDDGSGTTGTVLNNALFDTIQDNIDTALAQVIQIKTATYTLDALDDLVVFTTAGATLNLPAVNSVGGKTYGVINAATTGTVTIDPNSTEQIDGASTLVVQPGEAIQFKSTGATWFVVADRSGSGTWTPSLGGTATYTDRYGYWSKKGKEWKVWGWIHVNAIGTGSTGVVSGLPSTPVNVFAGSVGFFQNIAVNHVFLTCYTNVGVTTITFSGLTAAGVTHTNPANVFANGTSIYFTANYLTA